MEKNRIAGEGGRVTKREMSRGGTVSTNHVDEVNACVDIAPVIEEKLLNERPIRTPSHL